jgi:hypothetical protein
MATLLPLVWVVDGFERPPALSVLTDIPGSAGLSWGRFAHRPYYLGYKNAFLKLALILKKIKKPVY